jgi:2-polyprenyl-3-methyl-5-hydroxy-6-metoxy-1,4-benzoquinol methylase
LPGSRVLDAGCGPGFDAGEFAVRGRDVTGIDVTPSFPRAGRERDSDAAFARDESCRQS